MALLVQILLMAISLAKFSDAEFHLTITPARVEVGITDKVALDCRFRGSSQSTSISTISRIRILKETRPENYQIIAEVRELESEAHNTALDQSANVTGLIGNLSSSYLAISWANVQSKILGGYRCDIIGFKVNDDPVLEKTPVFYLTESNLTIHDILDIVNKQNADLEQRIQNQKSFCDSLIADAEASIYEKTAAVQNVSYNSNEAAEKALLARIAGLRANVNRLIDTGVLQYWPEGSYGLLTPDSGCPNSIGAQWLDGYRKFHTESTDRNYDQVSASSHLKPPTLERVDINNFMYQHFCVSNIRSPGADWPRGAYCINRVGGICPSRFNSGYITWQDEVTQSAASFSGALPDGSYASNSTSIYYCCRADGDPTDPVYLPKAKPFYLYRYNGTCQEVVGMRAVPGDMTFDTDNSHQDAYENSYHPDGNIDNVHIELCYYTET